MPRYDCKIKYIIHNMDSKKKTEQKNKNNKTKPENIPKCQESFGEKMIKVIVINNSHLIFKSQL